jgi:hypothetical protein
MTGAWPSFHSPTRTASRLPGRQRPGPDSITV